MTFRRLKMAKSRLCWLTLRPEETSITALSLLAVLLLVDFDAVLYLT